MKNQSSKLLKFTSTICLLSMLFFGFIKATNNEIILKEGMRATDKFVENCRVFAGERYYSMIGELHNFGQKFFDRECEGKDAQIQMEFSPLIQDESLPKIEIICTVGEIIDVDLEELPSIYVHATQLDDELNEITMLIESSVMPIN